MANDARDRLRSLQLAGSKFKNDRAGNHQACLPLGVVSAAFHHDRVLGIVFMKVVVLVEQ